MKNSENILQHFMDKRPMHQKITDERWELVTRAANKSMMQIMAERSSDWHYAVYGYYRLNSDRLLTL